MEALKQPDLSAYDPKKYEEERVELIKHLRASVSIHRLMKEKGIPESELIDHAYTFKRWLDDVEPCRGCKSLAECRQKQKGYRAGLSYDGLLLEIREACPYQVEQEKTRSHLDQYIVSDLADSFADAEFSAIDPTNEEKSYNMAVMEAVKLALDHKGAYLHGNMGTGKTHLAACAANQAAKDGRKVAFLHYPSFCDRLQRMYYSGEYRKEAEKCRYADLLVIDDIGAEEVTGRNRMVLLSILDARMQNGKMTWFTSNGDFETLRSHLRYARDGEDTAAADRIIERIRVLAKPVEVNGIDRRPSAG